MIEVLKEYNFKVNFSESIFDTDQKIILVEKDNKSSKFIFNFEESELENKNVLLKMKHYGGKTYEQLLVIKNGIAEFILTNTILDSGWLKMSLSLIGTENEILTNATFNENIKIRDKIEDGETPSEEDVSVIVELISELVEIKEGLYTKEQIDKLFNATEKKHYKYRVVITEEVEALTEYELPCNYKVGDNSLEIFYNNELLIKEASEDMEANYREVGTAGNTSNKVVFGWTLPIGSILNILVKGDYENETE